MEAARAADKGAEVAAKGITKSTEAAKAAAEEARYAKYWEKHAPEQSAPYSTIRRYTEDGEIKQITTYDKFGSRHRQYDLQDARRGEHQHNFDYGNTLSRLKGERSDHLPIDE